MIERRKGEGKKKQVGRERKKEKKGERGEKRKERKGREREMLMEQLLHS